MSRAPTIGLAIDHVVIATADLKAAAAALRALGFEVQPEGAHPAFGTINHTIMLENAYFELLAVGDPQPANAYLADHVARGGGLVGVALATPDAQASARRLALAQVRTSPVERFARPVETPRGPQEARFRTVRFAQPVGFDGYLFFCEHETPDLVWREGAAAHPNSARELTGVSLERLGGAAVDLAQAAEPEARGPWPEFAAERRIAIGLERLPPIEAARAGGFEAREEEGRLLCRHNALGDVTLVLERI